jgi:hypothetical protein
MPDEQKTVAEILSGPLMNQLMAMNNAEIDTWVDQQVKGIKETHNLLKLLTKAVAALARSIAS